MSNPTKTYFYTQDLIAPEVKIVQCGHVEGMSSWNYGDCNSPFWYLWRNAKAGGYMEWNGGKIGLAPDFFLLIPPFTRFSTHDCGRPLSQFYVHFTTGRLQRAVRREPITIPAAKLDPRPASEFFADLDKSVANQVPSALKLYGMVYKALELIPEEACLGEDEAAMDARVAAALKHISRNFRDKDACGETCRRQGISANHLARLFKADLGLTPAQYQMGRRIDEARNLLGGSSYSIDEIAEICGFADRHHFSKMFKKVAGVTPALCRNRMKALRQ